MSEREPLTADATLHRILLKVRPLPGHPLFWKMQFGFLRMWLFADSAEDAAERAMKLIAELPYERVGDQVAVETRKQPGATSGALPAAEGPSQEVREQNAIREQLAMESGLSLMLIIVPTGAEEADFDSMPLPNG